MRRRLLAKMVETARNAGALVMRHYAGDTERRIKADKSPVTAADEEAETLIILVSAHYCGLTLWRPEAIGPWNQFRRLGLDKVIAQPACGLRLSKHQKPAESD